MASRGRQKNLSFFAFTATPKAKTLEVFGRKDADGKPRPFHLYSMRQAIEEGFILDVLRNYTTYKTYWKLLKASADDPKVPKREAAAQLARFVSSSPAQHRPEDRGDGRALPRPGEAQDRRQGEGDGRDRSGFTPSATGRRSTSTSPRRVTPTSASLVAFSGQVEDRECRGRATPSPG